MFKKGFFFIALCLIIGMSTGCSSGNDSGEDLDISEIKEIESTGEFSEDEFFSADDGLDTKETELVDEVADLDEEISENVDGLEEGLSDELGLDDLAEESTDEVAALDGSDVLDELDEDSFDEESLVGQDEEVTVSAADLGFEEGDEDAGDLFDDGGTQGDVTVSDDELDLDSEDDLFRDEEVLAVEDDFSNELDESTTVAGDDLDFGDDFGDAPASEQLAEDVTIEDVDYSDQVASSGQSASDLLSEDDVSIDDVDYSNTTVAAQTTKSFVPVKKMQTVPYSKNGVLVNGVYFVRPGDSLADIGSKIYGNGSAVDFRIVNPHLKPGALKVGQKVYYNSPNRSQDRSRLLTYYEDVRMPAQTYAASAGENIRTISENLLGHPRSWMEVWASNQQIQEKWALEAPYRIRYWKGRNAPAPTLAKQVPPAPKPVAITPKAPKAVEVAAQETTSQASINLEESEEDIFDDPDMELDEPAEVAEQDDEDIFDDVIEEEPVEVAGLDEPVEVAELDEPSEIDEPADDNETAALAGVDGRGIARNKGGFPAKSAGLLGSDMVRKGILAGALLLLLVVGFLVVRRRKQSQNAIEMESFDFGGETTIDDAQEKTQIDL